MIAMWAVILELPELAVGVVFGSTIIALTLIPGVLVFFSDERMLQLGIGPLLRDVIFCFLSLALMVGFLFNGQDSSDTLSSYHMDLWETAVISSFFLVYLFVVFIPLACQKAPPRSVPTVTEEGEDAEAGGAATEMNEGLVGNSDTMEDKSDEDAGDASAESGFLGVCCKKGWDYFLFPLRFVYSVLMPPIKKAQQPGFCKCDCSKLYVLSFFIALFILAGWSILAVYLCKAIVTATTKNGNAAVSYEFLGAIVISFGAQATDILASVQLARNGFGEGALANCIGSQVVNVLLGVGFTFFCYSLAHNSEPLDLPPDQGDQAVLACTIASVVVFVLVVFAYKVIMSAVNKDCGVPLLINHWGAIVLLVTYVITTIVIIAFTLISV